MTSREQRALVLLGAGVGLVLILRFAVFGDRPADVVAPTNSIPLTEKRLAKLRQIAAMVPGKQMVLRQTEADLALREKGILQTQTANQAQAHLLEMLRRVGTANGLQVRGGEFLPPAALGNYGEVAVAVTFESRIDQLVNFLADLTKEPELIATRDLRISSANPKEKTVLARVVLSGMVPRRLVPEKKVTAF